MHVVFASEDWRLEGVITVNPGSRTAAVICHPHPLYGGNMNNPVVRAVEDGFQRAGFSTLRFNFRGTGESTGTHSGGSGEGRDLRAAVDFLKQQAGVEGVALAGYSFGAMVALQSSASIPSLSHLVVVAPPLTFFSLKEAKLGAVPKLFIAGDHDQYCDAVELTTQLGDVPEPKRSVMIGGADHFLFGSEPDIRAAVANFLMDEDRS